MGGAVAAVGRKPFGKHSLLSQTQQIQVCERERGRKDECVRKRGGRWVSAHVGERVKEGGLGLLTVLWYVRHVFTPRGFADCLFPFHRLPFNSNCQGAAERRTADKRPDNTRVHAKQRHLIGCRMHGTPVLTPFPASFYPFGAFCVLFNAVYV